MLFSSYTFLFWFLPPTLLFYFLPLFWKSPRRLALQNAVLLAASLFFYAWGEPLYLFLMVGTVLLDTLLGLLLSRACHRRAWLVLAVALHVGLLFYFKYAAFFAAGLGLSFSAPRLPLGISFYTFQALSYLIDVYRGQVPPQKKPALLGLYISLFPQLIAGPIVAYGDVATALSERTHTLHGAAVGTARFAAGLAKKLLLANPMGALFDVLIARGSALSALGALVALLAFGLQLYLDFSGYSDMALGLGRLFGFSFPENFRYPYISKSITEFWRRWHITLSAFFREYLYFPLGGSRRGRARTVFNLLVVWSLTGLWHGASWNFLLWGLYYFLLLVLEKFVLSSVLARLPLPLCHAGTLLAIFFGWLLFAFDGSRTYLSLRALPTFLSSLFGAAGALSAADAYEIRCFLPTLLLAALGSTPLPRNLFYRLTKKRGARWLAVALPLLALLLSVADLSDAGFNPFLYFRF